MPIISVNNEEFSISDDDFDWISERLNTSPSGTVSFTSSAIKRYRELTDQECEPAWKIRHQMINVFGYNA